MKITQANLAALRVWVVISWVGIIGGCSSIPELKPTSIVQSNIEQDRLTPNQSANKALVLDAYQHHLSAPVDAPLAVHAMSQFDFFTSDRQITVTLPELKQGREKVYLVEVNVPPETDNTTAALVSVLARYRDTASDKILTAQTSKALVYTLDPNLALTKLNKSVQRSLAILKTADVIDAVAAALRDKRPYKGVAILSKQSQDLRTLGTLQKDEELLRDARILDVYAQRLVSFTDESFQSLKIFRDLSWDTARYREAPK